MRMEEVKIKDVIWGELKWRTRGGRNLNGEEMRMEEVKWRT
jgi:hypothetical protein